MKKHADLEFIHEWPRKKIALSIIWGLLFLVISLVVNFLAGTYASTHADHAVRDIILDNIPAFNVSAVFIYGIILFLFFVGMLLILKPKRAPFVLKSLSLFIIFRSFFIILTHIGPSEEITNFSINSLASYFTFTGDLFFSAHTGMPFLMALIFWNDLKLRLIFLGTSIIFGITVLMGHLHYSIDVFSAFFITYGIYHISTRWFKEERALLETEIK